jgi:hypothetical protein
MSKDEERNCYISAFHFCLMTTLTVTTAWAVDVPAQNNTGLRLRRVFNHNNEKLTNPLDDVWSKSFQQNNYRSSTLS